MKRNVLIITLMYVNTCVAQVFNKEYNFSNDTVRYESYISQA
jgi:hypothetical protein